MGLEEGSCGSRAGRGWRDWAGPGRGREGAGEGGAAGLEGEDCLAAAAITQLGWTGSFLLPDLLPALEG